MNFTCQLYIYSFSQDLSLKGRARAFTIGFVVWYNLILSCVSERGRTQSLINVTHLAWEQECNLQWKWVLSRRTKVVKLQKYCDYLMYSYTAWTRKTYVTKYWLYTSTESICIWTTCVYNIFFFSNHPYPPQKPNGRHLKSTKHFPSWQILICQSFLKPFEAMGDKTL